MKRKLRVISLVLSVVMISVMLGACAGKTVETTALTTAKAAETTQKAVETTQKDAETTQAANDKIMIGYTSKTAVNDPYQQMLGDSIKAVVEPAGAEFVWLQSEGNAASAQQAGQIEDLISMGCDAIIVNANDTEAIATSLEAIAAANIYCVTVDNIGFTCDPNLYATAIGVDNYAAAYSGGVFLKEALGGKGNVILVAGISGLQVSQDRENGFIDGLTTDSNIQIVAQQNGEFNNDKGMQVMENMLQAHADADAVCMVSDVMLDGVLQAIANHGGVNPDMKVVSYDGSKNACEDIQNGVLLCDVAQFPSKVGAQAAQTCLDLISAKTTYDSYEDFTDVGSMVVSADNVKDYLAKYAF